MTQLKPALTSTDREINQLNRRVEMVYRFLRGDPVYAIAEHMGIGVSITERMIRKWKDNSRILRSANMRMDYEERRGEPVLRVNFENLTGELR